MWAGESVILDIDIFHEHLSSINCNAILLLNSSVVQAKIEAELIKVNEKIIKTQAQYDSICQEYQNKLDNEEMCSARYIMCGVYDDVHICYSVFKKSRGDRKPLKKGKNLDMGF